jgi:hypothetical protein
LAERANIARELTKVVHMAIVAAIGVPLAAAPGHYLHLGVLSISLTNALVIVVMVGLFVAALVVPFPRHEPKGPHLRGPEDAARDAHPN